MNINLNQGYSAGGSAQQANSYSATNAIDARAWSENAATTAFNRQKELMQMEMDYNSAEAQKARDWEEAMANTIYTRSTKNMREAGINPILAANMGLSGAAVGSGATASISGGSAPLAQNFMDSQSASQSSGSSWNRSENGLATALTAIGGMLSSALGAINSGINISMNMDAIKNAGEVFEENKNKILDNSSGTKWDKYTKKVVNNLTDAIGDNNLIKAMNNLQIQAIENSVERNKKR